MPASLMLNYALLEGEGKFLQEMKSQKVSYSKRVTIPEISPTQKVLGKTYTQPFKGSNCLLKTKLLYQLQEKDSQIDSHTRDVAAHYAAITISATKIGALELPLTHLLSWNHCRAPAAAAGLWLFMCKVHPQNNGNETIPDVLWARYWVAHLRQQQAGQPRRVCTLGARLTSAPHPRPAGQWKNVEWKKALQILGSFRCGVKTLPKGLVCDLSA